MALAQRLTRVPLSRVEFYISCNDLLDKDVSSKSDPCAIVYQETGTHWQELGRTENIENSLNPQFARTFELDYFFEEVQKLKVAVYDIDNQTPKLSDDDFLGAVECTMGQIVAGSPFKKNLCLKNGKPAGKGTITIRAQEDAKVNDILHLSFRAEKLDNKDTFGKSDPFLEFSRQLQDGTWQLVHRTEVVNNNLSPKWKPFQIKAQKFTGGNYEAPIRVSCLDYDDGGDSDLIGECQLTVPQLMKSCDQTIQWPCINPKKQAKKKSYKDSGIVFLTDFRVTKDYSFLDYVTGGMEIHCSVGLDFTASNGDPRSPQSLHYLNPQQPNEYQRAVHAVGTVIQDYDSDQMFPALGFGAKIPPNMEVSHEFAINFNQGNPFCAGVNGILQAYANCITQIQLYGPTNFSPIIYHAVQFATTAQKENSARNYFVLLIITDGVISDIRETIAAIVHASHLPMSIIIVGVGSADFKQMDVLDGDGGLLKDAHGRLAKRDIVQFVPYRNFYKAAPAELAKHVLAEVPRQVCDYYRMVNLAPCSQASAQVPGITQQLKQM